MQLRRSFQRCLSKSYFPFGPGQRHAMEVDYHAFRKELKAELKKVGVDIGKPPAGNKKLYKSENYFEKVSV